MCEYIPTAREKAREPANERKVYDIIADIRRLEAEQDALLNRLIDLTELGG